jgi:hypothetical protein
MHTGIKIIDGHGINWRMNKTNVTLAILALLQGILQADLYDTIAQLDAKYGEPTLIEETKRFYQSGPYIIEAHVTADDTADELGPNKCVRERHKRIDGKFLGSAEIKSKVIRRADNKPLFESEIHALLPTRRGIWRATGNGEYKADHGKARWKSGSKYLVILAN